MAVNSTILFLVWPPCCAAKHQCGQHSTGVEVPIGQVTHSNCFKTAIRARMLSSWCFKGYIVLVPLPGQYMIAPACLAIASTARGHHSVQT